jgi:hypothetical protein
MKKSITEQLFEKYSDKSKKSISKNNIKRSLNMLNINFDSVDADISDDALSFDEYESYITSKLVSTDNYLKIRSLKKILLNHFDEEFVLYLLKSSFSAEMIKKNSVVDANCILNVIPTID